MGDYKKQQPSVLKDFLLFVYLLLINKKKKPRPSHLNKIGCKSHTFHEKNQLLSMLTAQGDMSISPRSVYEDDMLNS